MVPVPFYKGAHHRELIAEMEEAVRQYVEQMRLGVEQVREADARWYQLNAVAGDYLKAAGILPQGNLPQDHDTQERPREAAA